MTHIYNIHTSINILVHIPDHSAYYRIFKRIFNYLYKINVYIRCYYVYFEKKNIFSLLLIK